MTHRFLLIWFLQLLVLVGGAEGEAVGGEVGVDAVKAAGQDVVLVALFHDEGDEDAVVRRAPDAVGAAGRQELRPGLRRHQFHHMARLPTSDMEIRAAERKNASDTEQSGELRTYLSIMYLMLSCTLWSVRPLYGCM
ncbi:hypothetical protein EYF80_041896 [Liparis tanakae]|uniref:Uncharacterized protein n=1 Tax=Liparis tanakae TaxID=230148 RepID=A0A4Z2G491_9TELE|nr:hypothetical protein EYF80_041896 [Liparis tanakae]